MSIGSNIHSIRMKSGLTAEQFASKIGCGKASLYLYESDERNPPVVVVRNLCRAFKISADWVLDLKESGKRTIDVTNVPEKIAAALEIIAATSIK